jgi:Ankyrin repeats (3 copies)
MSAIIFRLLAAAGMAFQASDVLASDFIVACGQDPVSSYVRSIEDQVNEASVRDGYPMPVSALENAVVLRFNGLVRTLSENHDRIGRHGANALYAAAQIGNVEATEILISSGVSPNAAGDYNFPLEGAVQNGCIDEVKSLLDHGADVNGRRGSDYGLVSLAVFGGQYEIAKILMRHGYRITAQEKGRVRRYFTRRGEEGVYREIFAD